MGSNFHHQFHNIDLGWSYHHINVKMGKEKQRVHIIRIIISPNNSLTFIKTVKVGLNLRNKV